MTEKLLLIIQIMAAVTAFGGSCASGERSYGESRPAFGENRIILSVSDMHFRELAPITEKNTAGIRLISDVFRELDERGDAYCLAKNEKEIRESGLIRSGYIQDYLKSGKGGLKSLVAGCWNFLEMNDYRPDLDFALMKKLLPDVSFDCYSVGFLQPYVMHSELRCASLTMTDIDWRILDAHRQFTEFRRNGYDSLSSLSRTQSGWIALRGNYGPDVSLSADLVCRPIQKEQCIRMLKKADEIPLPEKITLNLSALHDMQFRPRSGSVPVVFLSNAIDETYTSESEFRRMLQRSTENLKQGENAWFIYHTGGWKLFGIYKTEKSTGNTAGFRTETVCKDVYQSISKGKDGKPAVYETYFERISVNARSAPSCASLLSRLQTSF